MRRLIPHPSSLLLHPSSLLLEPGQLLVIFFPIDPEGILAKDDIACFLFAAGLLQSQAYHEMLGSVAVQRLEDLVALQFLAGRCRHRWPHSDRRHGCRWCSTSRP